MDRSDSAVEAPSAPDDAGQCPSDRRRCGDLCVTSDDPAFGCGAASCLPCAQPDGHAAGICVAGSCAVGPLLCPTGQNRCGQACVDFQKDPAHCGNCTTACTATQACAAGQCVNAAPQWRAVNVDPAYNFEAVWGAAANDVWAVGQKNNAGAMMHWDGNSWSPSAGSVSPHYGVWGASANQVWAAGNAIDNGYLVGAHLLAWNGTGWGGEDLGAGNLWAIWGSKREGLVWAVGDRTAGVYQRSVSNGRWSRISSSPASGNLYGMWGTDAGSVILWLVGNGGTIVRWNSGAALNESSGTSSHLYGVWGSSESDVWAVGEQGTLLHRNANGWSAQSSGSSRPLYGVWGAAANDVWVVGNSGTALHWNGGAWLSTAVPTTAHLKAVWGSSASDVWAVGAQGTLLHYTP